MSVLSAEWQRSAVQKNQAHGTETSVRMQKIFPNVPCFFFYIFLFISMKSLLLLTVTIRRVLYKPLCILYHSCILSSLNHFSPTPSCPPASLLGPPIFLPILYPSPSGQFQYIQFKHSSTYASEPWHPESQRTNGLGILSSEVMAQTLQPARPLHFTLWKISDNALLTHLIV